jgi:hypothetical protein
MKEIKTTNFGNDAKRLITWLVNGAKNRDNSKIGGFFSRIWREMKR